MNAPCRDLDSVRSRAARRRGASFVAALALPWALACADQYDGTLPPYGSPNDDAGTPRVSGGGSGAADSGAAAEYSCDTAALALDDNAVRATTPRISIGKRIVASEGVTNPGVLVDGNYHQGTAAGFGVPKADAPRSVSIELAPPGTAAPPARILAIWKDAGWEPYTSAAQGAPADYHFEVSPDSTDGVDGTWSPAGDPVTGNTVNNRGHALPFAGQRWLRLVVTAAPAESPAVSLDELSIHDVSASPSGLIDDSWVFFGDSITQISFQRDIAAPSVFDAKVAAANAARFPAFVNAGVGGDLTASALARLEQALTLNADFKYFAIGFGTNDSWGNQQPASTSFESNMRTLIARVREAGRVPVLARIPFASGVNMASGAPEHETIPAFNAIIDALQAEFSLPCGPDLYQVFASDRTGLDTDGVHPNANGDVAIHAAWAERAALLYAGAN